MRTLGNVVYWITCGIAVLIVLVAVSYVIEVKSFEGSMSGDNWVHAISFGLLALPVWLVGWALRRVLVRR